MRPAVGPDEAVPIHRLVQSADLLLHLRHGGEHTGEGVAGRRQVGGQLEGQAPGTLLQVIQLLVHLRNPRLGDGQSWERGWDVGLQALHEPVCACIHAAHTPCRTS